MMKTREVKIGNITMGGGSPLVVQTMCNTHTSDVEASVAQCVRLYEAGAQMLRLTVPTLADVNNIAEIRTRLRDMGIDTPIVADVHFSADIAVAVAPVVDKVRINPGNFSRNHELAAARFKELTEVCRTCGTAIRIGLNHGSLGERITTLYGNTAFAMKEAAMEWLKMAVENDFYDIVVSLKASNTFVMTEAYRLLAADMEKSGLSFPIHLGVTEAGNGDAGRMKSVVGISSLLKEGIGDTVRVSLTEDPENELPVAWYIADRFSRRRHSSMTSVKTEGRTVKATYSPSTREQFLLDVAWDWGKALLDKNIDTLEISDISGLTDNAFCEYLVDELMQACRRRFYRPEYIACPGCGRTMYNLEDAFERVKAKTANLKGMVIAVMGCVVNGPGEMADADWGYVGEGNGLISIYKGKEAVRRHIPESEAPDLLLQLIQSDTVNQ